MQRLLGGIPPAGRGPAPVHLWNPPWCGDIDMRIAADGSWHYNGSPIGRPAMVKLFATILRKDPTGHVLVTPVERVGITVEDAPFLAVDMAVEPGEAGDRLVFRTNVDDIIEAGPDHPIRFEIAAGGALKPYLHVRGDLWALVTRALTHDLVARASVEAGAGGAMFGLRSGTAFFPIAPAEDLDKAP